jgi:cytochrome c553
MTAIRLTLLAPLALTFTLSATLAHAGDDRYTLSNAYVQECGACHTAYPPALLPKESWQRLMGGLDKHYGTDASLDATAQKSIGDWVLAHAGSGKRARTAPPEDRITRGDWFVREHREVPKAAWTRTAIKSASNCGACHRGANEGDYDEDRISIPR